MPFFNVTKNTRRNGLQTFARAQRLPPPLKEVELQYLDVRDWYMQTVGVKAQYEEALEQAKSTGDDQDIKMYGEKLKGFDGQLVDKRQRVRDIGEKSFAEAIALAAEAMLPHEIYRVINIEAERLLGRPRHELRKTQ